MDLNQIKKPELLLDKNIAKANIEKMISKCKKDGISLRPHFKTHQSHEVASWFRSAGITKITVSSVDMAAYFAADSWKNILIAFPFNPREKDRIKQLAKEVDLTLTIPCPESAQILSELDIENISVMLKIDTGYGRSGMNWNDTNRIQETIAYLESNNKIRLKGLLTHSGNTYDVSGSENVLSIYTDTVKRLNFCKESIKRDDLLISIGDTPSASISESFDGIDELRPGNFIFYDLMQYFIGACRLDDISVAYACPVVDMQNDGKKAIIHGGGVHLSKESLKNKNKSVYGMAVSLTHNSWNLYKEPLYISSLSQEHGIIESDKPLPSDFKIGSLIGILPVHSCLTANLSAGYTNIESGQHIDHMNSHRMD